MRTRESQPDVPAPDSPWDEIEPGLWMGGHQVRGPVGRVEPVVVHRQFDLVQTLLRLPEHGPDPGWSTRCGPSRTARSTAPNWPG